MNTQLRRLFDILEADRIQLLHSLSNLSSEKISRTSGDRWSVLQILAHLMTAEQMSVAYMNKKILGIHQVDNTGAWEEMKMILLTVSQRFPFKFKAPKTVVDHTPVYTDLEQLKTNWDREREELRKLLEKFDDHQLNKKIYRHVRAGLLNIQHALIFFREHHLHHMPQIKRLL